MPPAMPCATFPRRMGAAGSGGTRSSRGGSRPFCLSGIFMELFDTQGRRPYLTAKERGAFVEAANNAEREVRTFCLVLVYTGCRISEALASHA